MSQSDFLTKLTGIALIVALSSCLSTKQLTYYQGKMPSIDSASNGNRITLIPGTTIYIQANTFGDRRENVHNPFQPVSADPTALPSKEAIGYIVSDSSTITLPLIGRLNVKNKTPRQAADAITLLMQKYFNDPSVVVKLLSFNITVLGEVNKPGFYVYNYYEMSLPLALGLAGDLTTYARRDNILIMHRNGKHGRLDLTNASVVQSPFYNLQSGDVIYVSPSKTRSQSLDNNYRLLPIILSAVSVIGTIILALK